MKIVKHYWFVAIALITMISFSSCESDEERGFDISGLYGKTWWGDMGFEDRYGEPLYSYITFTSGAFTDHGVGTEERCYYNDELYRVYKFDWEIQNGWLYLYYSDGYTFIIEYPSVSGRYFYGTAEDGFEIRYNPQNEMFRLLGTKRSFSQNETFFFSHPYPPTLPFSA